MDNGNLRVIDFKTGGKSDNNFQLKLYKFLIEKRYGKNVEKASFYYLKDATIQDFDLRENDVGVIEGEVLGKIEEILSEKKFEPTVSKLCKFCDFLAICPAKTEAREIIGESSETDYSDDLPF